MSNKNKYIALPGGNECREVNPYEKAPGGYALSQQWIEFEAHAPILPLTEVIPKGVEFIGSQLMKESFNGGKTWVDCRVDGYDPICSTGAIHKVFVKPLKAKEPVKQEYDVIMKTYTPVCPTCKNKHPQFCSDSFHINPANKPLVDVVENKETVCPTCKNKHPEYCSNAFHLIHRLPTPAVDESIEDFAKKSFDESPYAKGMRDNHASFVALVECMFVKNDQFPESYFTEGYNKALNDIIAKVRKDESGN